MNKSGADAGGTPVGQAALHHQYCPQLSPPHVLSFTNTTARRTVQTPAHTYEYYSAQYANDGSVIDNLRFALRYEPLDFRILCATFKNIGCEPILAWVQAEPTGAFSRRAWFLYERLTGGVLPLEPVKSGNYVDALDVRFHFTAAPINSARHRVRDNLLGTHELCPTVRRTDKLDAFINLDLKGEAADLINGYDPDIFARAINFLFTKETRSSFAIEGEAQGSSREERFLHTLRDAQTFLPATEDDLIRLQASIVDERYVAKGWRDFQNFVAETTRGFGEHVHFIPPRPEDVPRLMRGWLDMVNRIHGEGEVDAVVAAAITAFTFVFIHPFEDGNGRIHRFLIHAMLSSSGYSPPGVIFPVSAAILRNRQSYDMALEDFSKPVLLNTEWSFDSESRIHVGNQTIDLFRFFDATAQVEFLYSCVLETIRSDIKGEADFVEVFDAALYALREVVDMPDRRASLLVKLCMQNGGRLSQSKRKQFAELTDDEVVRIETALTSIMQARL